MNANSVMNTYNMASFWKNINLSGASGSISVPLVSNLDSSLDENNA